MKLTLKATTRRQVLKAMAGTAAALAWSRTTFAAEPDGSKPIILGNQGDLTGALSHDGIWEQRAIEAAAKWHNGRGGIAGRAIKVVSVDTETKTEVGIRRLQQLIREDNCDFVIGSGSGGIGVASVPIASDAKVVYLPLARTDSITTQTANPYLYRLVSNSSIAARACQNWMLEKVGKRWTMVLSDLAFGHSQREAFDKALKSVGGELVQAIALPANLTDPLPYLLKIDKSVDGIVTALWGPDSVRTYPALATAGVKAKPKLAVSSTANLFDVVKLGSAVEGLYAFDEVPWELQDYSNPEMTKAAFDAIGIGDNGRAKVGDDFVMLPSAISAWEYVSFIKQAIEGSGWQSKDDGMKLSNWVAAHPKMPTSELFLRTNLSVRKEDQQAFADVYILQVKAGHMRVVDRVAADATVFPSPMIIQR